MNTHKIKTKVFGEKCSLEIMDFTRGNDVEDMAEGTIFPDGSIYRQKHVGEQLRKFYAPGSSMFPSKNFGGNIENTNKEMMKNLPTRNYASSGFKDWFQKNANNGSINRYSSKEQIARAVKEGKLKSVEEVNNLWRCFNIKGGHQYKGRNDPSYLALHPKALDVLKDLTKAFQEKLSNAGLDRAKWSIRPKVESLVRDEKMSNGSNLSPHEFGLGIDFTKARAFDLIYVPDNTFMVIDKGKDNLLYRAVETLFMEALQDIDKSDRVIITSEYHPPHFHIATKN